jgi:hypothetical protein
MQTTTIKRLPLHRPPPGLPHHICQGGPYPDHSFHFTRHHDPMRTSQSIRVRAEDGIVIGRYTRSHLTNTLHQTLWTWTTA